MTNEDAATKEMLKKEVLAAAKDDPSLTHQEIGEILWKAVRKRRRVN